MSNRERAAALLEAVPDNKLGYVLAFLQGLTADEAADDAYCLQMYQDYLADPDHEQEETYSLADCAKEWGLA